MKATVIDVNPMLDALSRREGVGMNAPVFESWVARNYGNRWKVPCISTRMLRDFGHSEGGAFEQLTFAKSVDAIGYGDFIGQLPHPIDFSVPSINNQPGVFSILVTDDGFLVMGEPNEVNRHWRDPNR